MNLRAGKHPRPKIRGQDYLAHRPVDRQREGVTRAQAGLHRFELAGRTGVAGDRRVVYRGVAPRVDQKP